MRRLDCNRERLNEEEALLGDLRRIFTTVDPVPPRARSAAQVAFVVHARQWWRDPAVTPTQTGLPAKDRLVS